METQFHFAPSFFQGPILSDFVLSPHRCFNETANLDGPFLNLRTHNVESKYGNIFLFLVCFVLILTWQVSFHLHLSAAKCSMSRVPVHRTGVESIPLGQSWFLKLRLLFLLCLPEYTKVQFSRSKETIVFLCCLFPVTPSLQVFCSLKACSHREWNQAITCTCLRQHQK